MTKYKSNIALGFVLIMLILNFSLSSISMGIKRGRELCAMNDVRCCSCCAMNSASSEINSNSYMIDLCGDNNNKSVKDLSVCNCNHGADVDTDFLLSVIKTDFSQNEFPQSFITFNKEICQGKLIDYSILDFRINPPPIYISVSSFLI